MAVMNLTICDVKVKSGYFSLLVSSQIHEKSFLSADF